mmetsp:Transcript_15760/g.22110  ORF Transcript_15760/g.22110 Transcript_15760/m.22110 type:complete len:86 (-) Transcript_15760:23-280(-)
MENPAERMPTISRHNLHPCTPQQMIVSDMEVEANCPTRVPNDPINDSFPNSCPLLSEGTISATQLCIIGETENKKEAARVRQAIN